MSVINKARFAMKYGSPAHQEKVLKGNGNRTMNVRWRAAIDGKKQHLDILVHDKDPDVRAAVATHGYKEHLDRLINDKEPVVRAKVAYHGTIEHTKRLENDPDPEVRKHVDMKRGKFVRFKED